MCHGLTPPPTVVGVIGEVVTKLAVGDGLATRMAYASRSRDPPLL